MNAPTTEPPAKAPRPRSSKRRRHHVLGVRLDADERLIVKAAADARGLSPAGLARALLLQQRPPQHFRRRALDAPELAQLAGQLGKVGSNLNQLARRANEGHVVAGPELAAAVTEVRAAVARVVRRLARPA